MPEVFHNHYLFPDGAVPAAEAFLRALAPRFGETFTLETHEQGFHGAPRAYARLSCGRVQLWIYWEPERPEVEISMDRSMQRMLIVNAALIALGGAPRYPDAYWKGRRRSRAVAQMCHHLVMAFLAALAFAAVWYLHWWGLLLLVALLITGVCLYIIGMARAYSNR